MPELRVVTPEGLVLRREIAGAGSRFCAGAIDGVILLGVLLALALLVWILAQADPSGLSALLLGALGGGTLLVVIGYHFVFALKWGGSTPGKRVLGLRVVSAGGWPATPAQHLLRSLLWPLDVFLPVPVPFGLLGLVLIATTGRRQRLGDLVAGTLVLREVPESVPREPAADKRWSQLAERTLALSPGLAARLDDEDRTFLRELLARQGLDRATRRRLEGAAAQLYEGRLELGHSAQPGRTLRELYLYLRESREGGPT